MSAFRVHFSRSFWYNIPNVIVSDLVFPGFSIIPIKRLRSVTKHGALGGQV